MTDSETYAFKCGVYESAIRDIKVTLDMWKRSALGGAISAILEKTDKAIADMEALEKDAGK